MSSKQIDRKFRYRPQGRSSIIYKKNALASCSHEGVLAGADNQIRTGDLILTKDALYLLSYISAATNSILTDSVRICKPFCQIS